MFIINDDKYNFDTQNIEIRNITKINDKCLKIPIKINLNGKKKPFLIQTPKMYVPFGVNLNGQYQNKNIYLDLSFRDKEYNNCIKNFFNFIKQIKIRLKKILISEKIINNSKNNKTQFIDSIKKDKYGERITTKFNNIEGKNTVTIYDNKKNKKNIQDIKKGIFAVLILNLSDIWITLDKKSKIIQYGFSWIIMQMKIYEPLSLDKYCSKPLIVLYLLTLPSIDLIAFLICF